jgi:uncharacterized membrane protein (UPF0182 family)
MAAHLRLAAYARHHHLCARRFLHPHHRGSRCARQAPQLSHLPWRGLSITFAFLLLILAVRVYLGRFDLLFDDHTVFGGVTYTDAHITLTGMLLVCVALVAGAVAAAANAMTVARGRWLVAAILPARSALPAFAWPAGG